MKSTKNISSTRVLQKTRPQEFVRREPLRRVHECVLGILALEG
jgi:hypothetical protein